MNNKKELAKNSSSDYLAKATLLYDSLKTNYKYQGSLYWPLGCTLDSMIDFLNIAVPAGNVTLEDAQAFLNTAADNYEKNGDWYDDWGWWGNATAKVFDENYKTLFDDPGLKEKFKNICKYCFNYMKTGDKTKNPIGLIAGAPQAYNVAVKQANENPSSKIWYDIVTKAKPVWNIGCWQYFMAPSDNPIAPNAILGPFQDTVVNGLYYLLTQRVLSVGYSTHDDVLMMANYFRNWMNKSTPSLSPEKQIFNQLSTVPEAGLFRERISIYHDGSTVNGYDEYLGWTGDQGLMLSALTLSYKTSKDSATLKLIKAIIRGVTSYSILDNVIMPWSRQNVTPQPGLPPDNDRGDYSSGTGVFMRGLLHASTIPEVMTLISEAEIQTVLITTANICANNKYPYGGDTVFQQFNELATLTAVSKLIESVVIEKEGTVTM